MPTCCISGLYLKWLVELRDWIEEHDVDIMGIQVVADDVLELADELHKLKMMIVITLEL